MKKIPLILSALALLATTGCKKDNTEPQTEQHQYLPTAEGSWWAYAIIQHDGQGGSTVQSRDTLRAIGETVIGEHTYATYQGSLSVPYQANMPRWHVRDSANHLLYENSFVMLPYLNFTDTFNRMGPEANMIERYQKLYKDAEPLSLPLGTFNTIDFRTEVVFQNTTPCETNMGYMHKQFAEHVGMVRATYWYANSYGCGTYTERRLEAYHIEE